MVIFGRRSASLPAPRADRRAPALGLALALLGAFAPAHAQKPAKEERRLAVFPLMKRDGVPARTHQTVGDAVAAEASFAADKRGYMLVPLRKVAGLEQEAKACTDAGCRKGILERLGADFALVGAVSTAGRDYKVELWLEGKDGQVISLQDAQGRMFTLTAKIPDLTSSVLEAGSSKESVTRDRLAKTAVSYEQAGRPKDAVRTYGRAIALNPFHADAARLSIKILHVWERSGEADLAEEALETLLSTYGPQSPWGQAGLGGPEVQEEVGRAVSAFLVREGNRQHESAIVLAEDKSKAAERQTALARAFDAYERALKLYPDGKVDSGEVAFHLAEVAFELGRFDDAIHGYTLASTQGPVLRQQEASIGLCFALEARLAKAGIYDANKSHKVPEKAQRLPTLLVTYLSAVDQLAERFKLIKEATIFSFRAAQAELAFGHKNAGKARLQKAIELNTDEESVGRAKRLLGKL